MFHNTTVCTTPPCTYGLLMLGSDRPMTVDVFAARLADRFGGARHGGRGNGHHQLDVRKHAHDRLRLGKRLVAVIVARPNGRERQARDTFRPGAS